MGMGCMYMHLELRLVPDASGVPSRCSHDWIDPLRYPFEDLERGVQFVDEELMLTADEMPSANISSFLERDLVEDAVDGEDEM